MVLGVARTAVALVVVAKTGWGITIPLSPVAARLSTGISNSTGNLLIAGANDDSWVFFNGTTPLTAYVVRSDRAPIAGGTWASNNSNSQWISPTVQNYSGQGSGCCELPTSPLTNYTAALTFNIPAMTNPPNLSQWWLVMSGLVWGDDRVTGFALFPGATPSGTPVYSYSYNAPLPSPTTSQSFSLQTWVNANEQYTLAFYLENTNNTVTGFRLQMTEAYVTPEPGAWALMLSAGAGLAYASWRRGRAKKPEA